MTTPERLEKIEAQLAGISDAGPEIVFLRALADGARKGTPEEAKEALGLMDAIVRGMLRGDDLAAALEPMKFDLSTQ